MNVSAGSAPAAIVVRRAAPPPPPADAAHRVRADPGNSSLAIRPGRPPRPPLLIIRPSPRRYKTWPLESSAGAAVTYDPIADAPFARGPAAARAITPFGS